jgi:tRNA (mo5U34)-methyltransferase
VPRFAEKPTDRTEPDPDDAERLRKEIVRLGPWSLEIEVAPGISTRASLDAGPGAYPETLGKVGFYSPREAFQAMLQRLYPGGLAGRSVLDCACNCGAYLFWAKELGAGRCLGFDVRERWIDQARFLAQNRTWPSDGIEFEVCDLYDLPELGLEPFDITLFNGIFYHLPDPIRGLRIAADLTEELIVVGTSTRSGLPDDVLAVSSESDVHVMSGVYGLNWLPGGPRVLEGILRWAGFVETHPIWWLEETPESSPGWGRLDLAGSKKEGLLMAFNWPTIRRWFNALDSGVEASRHALRAHCHPDLELLVRSGDGSAATYRGHEELKAFLARLVASLQDGKTFGVRMLFDEGDTVAASVFRRDPRRPGSRKGPASRGAKLGSPMRDPAGWIFSFREGRIARIDVYPSSDQALAAAGAGPGVA